MKKSWNKLSNDQKLVICGIGIFAGYMLLCKTSSDIGDYYFPRERFMSDDFWNWKPQ
jgi:hypothetical protein